MNIDDLKQILDVVREHEISEFELEDEGFKLRVRRRGPEISPETASRFAAAAVSAVAPAAPEAALAARGPVVAPEAPAAATEPGVELAIVKSPIVGTFYRAPEPGARSFVEVGAVVRKGQVLCIIEAMKLMNEINSEYDGEVMNVYVENGQAVQYGERLFAIRRT
jgi:acetyl-CoA carboxylase biotin carboxyl carrier protein